MANSFREKAEKKRTSAGNPAMMFITPPEEDHPEELDITTDPETGRKKLTIHESPAQKKLREERIRAEEAGRKRREAEASTLKAGTPTLKRAPQGGEAKTRRLQLLIQPSLYEAVRARAEAEGMSVNETIGELLRQALGE